MCFLIYIDFYDIPRIYSKACSLQSLFWAATYPLRQPFNEKSRTQTQLLTNRTFANYYTLHKSNVPESEVSSPGCSIISYDIVGVCDPECSRCDVFIQ